MASSARMFRPHILVFLADQHRADCLAPYGNRELRTPHLSALAADGVRFDNAFCPFPVCTPSRYSLLSGLYVHEHLGSTNHCTLPPGTETFPRLLKGAGYRTAAVGKMHFTPTYLDVGFDHMVLVEQDGPGRWDDDYHRDLQRLGLVDVNDLEDQRAEYRKDARPEYWETFGALPSNLPAKHHSTEWIGDRALKMLDEWGDEPRLLMVGFVKPHHPFDPPQEWSGLYDPDTTPPLAGWTPECFPHDLELHKGYFPHEKLTEKDLRRITAYYYATIQHMDAQIGKIVDLLKHKGLYDNTLILYTADHGEYMGYHHLLLKGGYMYDPLVRVPLIIKYPASKQKGAVSEALVSLIDLAPTILQQAGCRPGAKMHGLDLAEHSKGRKMVFAESGRGDQVMVRTSRHKLIVSRSANRAFLYDLKTDPFETLNLFGKREHGRAVDTLTKAVEAWRGPDRLPPYLDEDAPVIDGPNVPPRDRSYRDAIIAYYRDKMDEHRSAKI